MRILIADDDPVSRRRLEGALARLNREFVAVTDGNAALEALMAPNGPELAILDWMMPGLDGLAVCREIRQRSDRYVYVILLTARDRREDMVTALDAGADDFLTKPFDTVELRARLGPGERVVALEAQLRHQATHDTLTGQYNRRMILDELGRAIARSAGERQPIAVAVVDIDHFKRVNDTHGHAGGDAVIQAVADRIRSVLRKDDALGRYGGEEFLLVLPGCDGADARTIAERACLAVSAAPVTAAGAELAITVSIGVATAAAAATSPDGIIESADLALYRAKAAGRNRVES